MSGFKGFKGFQQQKQQNQYQSRSSTSSNPSNPPYPSMPGQPVQYNDQQIPLQQPMQSNYSQNFNQNNNQFGPGGITGSVIGMGIQPGMPAAPQDQSYSSLNNSFQNPGYPSGIAQQASGPQQPSYQPTAQTYAAYPEYDPEFNVKANISYQHGSVQKGWNDPPPSIALKKSESYLDGILNPESTVVGTLSNILSIVKQQSHPSKQRMIDDTEKRMDSLFDLLASKSLDKHVLASTYSLVMNGIEKRDFFLARKECGDLLTAVQEHARWIVGLKRLIELYEQIQM